MSVRIRKFAQSLQTKLRKLLISCMLIKLGDDATVVAMRIRHPRCLTMLVVAPVDPRMTAGCD